MEREQEYNNGFEAYYEGASIIDNPWQPGTDLAMGWNEGYCDALAIEDGDEEEEE